jgi:hypothetical protein
MCTVLVLEKARFGGGEVSVEKVQMTPSLIWSLVGSRNNLHQTLCVSN